MTVGLFLHAGIGLFMGLGPFSTTMLSTYFLFISPLILEQKVVVPLRSFVLKTSQN